MLKILKLGAILSLSSWGAPGGVPEKNAMLMAVDDINTTGGVLGKKLEIIFEDNRASLKETATAFRKLVNIDKVPAILGPNWAEFVKIAAPLAEAEKIVMLSASGYKKGAFENRKYAFTTWPKHEVATKPLSDYIANKQYKNITALITKNAFYGAIFEAMQKQLAKKGVLIQSINHFNEGARDFNKGIARLKSSKVDAVVALLLETGDLASFLKQAKTQRLKADIYTGNGLSFSETIQNDLTLANDVIYFDYKLLATDEFIERYKTLYNSTPGFSSSRAYDNVFMIKEAIEECGLEREAIQRCLSNMKYHGISGEISFAESGVIKGDKTNTEIFRVKDGSIEGASVIKFRKYVLGTIFSFCLL